MFSFLYSVGIAGYEALLRLAGPFHAKARLAVDGRRGWAERLRAQLRLHAGPVVWFHAASLGEFEQGRPVIEAFRAAHPDDTILLTFFSPSGYEVRKNYAVADVVSYLPFDTGANARLFLDIVQPRLAVFIKYEFWRNFLLELHARPIRTVLFSAIFRPDQLFFKPWGGPYRNLLGCFAHILVQNQTSLDLLTNIGLINITLAGDTRFDRVWAVAHEPNGIHLADVFLAIQPFSIPPNRVLVVGSAWSADMDVLIPVLNQYADRLTVIVAPHEIRPDEISRWRLQLQARSVLYSELAGYEGDGRPSPRILFVDNIGLLSRLYQYGNLAYVGGGFGRGIHNTLEAAAFGMPLFFGPNYTRFQEAVDLVAEGGAVSVQTPADFAQALHRWLTGDTAHRQAADVCYNYVARNIGATAKVMGQLLID